MPDDLHAEPVEDVADAELRSEGIASPQASASPFVPLQQPIFRAIWFATLVSNFGGLIQAVAASPRRKRLDRELNAASTPRAC